MSSSIGAIPPPDGTTANFINPETSDRLLGILLASVGMAIMSTIMGVRMYTKTVMVRMFGIDDIIALVAWVISVSTQSLYIYLWATKLLGTHLWDLTVAELNTFSKIISFCSIAGVMTPSLAKTALLLSYRKLWLMDWFKITTFVVLIYEISSYCTALVLTLIFACVPIAKNWDVSIKTGHCINRSAVYIASAGLSASTDVLMFILPMPMIYKLRLRPFQKAGMVLIFGIGSLTIIISMVFLSLFIPSVLAGNVDTTWELSKLVAMTSVEANLVLICGCFPALKLWLRRTAPGLFGTERGIAGSMSDVVTPGGGDGGGSWGTQMSVITTTTDVTGRSKGSVAKSSVIVGERGREGSLGLEGRMMGREGVELQGRVREDSIGLQGRVREDSIGLQGRVREDSIGLQGRVREDSIGLQGRVREDSVGLQGRVREDSIAWEEQIRQDSIALEGRVRQDSVALQGRVR